MRATTSALTSGASPGPSGLDRLRDVVSGERAPGPCLAATPPGSVLAECVLGSPQPLGRPAQGDVADAALVERPVGGQLGLDPEVGELLAPRPCRLEVAYRGPVVEARVADVDLGDAVGVRFAQVSSRTFYLAECPRAAGWEIYARIQSGGNQFVTGNVGFSIPVPASAGVRLGRFQAGIAGRLASWVGSVELPGALPAQRISESTEERARKPAFAVCPVCRQSLEGGRFPRGGPSAPEPI